MRSNSSSHTAVTLTVGVLATAFGLCLGNLSAKYEGIDGTKEISQEIASSQLDSTRIPIAGSPARGGINAAATVVFFADFQCKASRALYGKLMDDVFKIHGDDVNIVYKAFPLSSHNLAPMAAQAAFAAKNQGKFWEMFDAIYAAGEQDATGENYLKPENLRKYAQKIGLAHNRYDQALNAPDTLAAIQKDIELGKKLDVQKTPSIFINGKPVSLTKGVNGDELMAAVNREVKNINGILAKPNAKYYLAERLDKSFVPAASATMGTDLGRSVKGAPNALVTIVEFSDYECPFCSRVEPTIERLLKTYPNDVRVIFTHNPLSFHKNAKLAAQAAYAAGRQNKFWEMHKRLFDNQKRLTRNDLLKYAADLHLDQAMFAKDLDDPATVAVIESNIAEAKKFGFSGTPAFLINNQPLSGAQPFELFQKAIDEELAEAKAVSQKTGLTGDALFQELLKSYKPADKKAKRGNVPAAMEGKIFVDVSGAPSYGAQDAPVVIVEFTDFQCPFCSRANTTVKQLIDNNPGKVRLVFKHNPLAMHKDAQLAHQAAEAASLQGKFWEYYQILFDNQKALSRENLIEYAKRIDLDIAAFEKDLDSDTVKNRVAADLSQGKSVNVQGTPHFFINGTRFSGARPLEDFQRALNKELDIAKSYTDKGLSGEELYRTIIADGKADNKRLLRGQNAPELPPVIQVDTAGCYTKGPDDAPVTIVQFSDYQCPFCKTVEPTLAQLMKDYEGKIRDVIMNRPLAFHADAKLAAEAALAAGEQGKFWEMHDLLFKNNKALKREHLNIYADTLGLNRAQFDEALDTHKFRPDVERDLKRAEDAKIDATPSFLINGRLYSGAMPIEDFKKHIDKALSPADPPPFVRPPKRLPLRKGLDRFPKKMPPMPNGE